MCYRWKRSTIVWIKLMRRRLFGALLKDTLVWYINCCREQTRKFPAEREPRSDQDVAGRKETRGFSMRRTWSCVSVSDRHTSDMLQRSLKYFTLNAVGQPIISLRCIFMTSHKHLIGFCTWLAPSIMNRKKYEGSSDFQGYSKWQQIWIQWHFQLWLHLWSAGL